MALQKVFKHDYLLYLRNNINVNDYLASRFPYDSLQVCSLSGIHQPEDLLKKMDPNSSNEFQSSVALYEAYENITPIFAQQDDLWVYLSHVDLFDYVRKRWPLEPVVATDDKKKIENHIINHWHRNLTNFLRTSFAGMWWKVYLTRDSSRKDPYELTKVMYDCGTDFVGQRFGELSMIRYKESMIGILEFLRENPELYKSNFVARGQYISRYFNLLGGVKQITALDRNFFYEELCRKRNLLYNLKATDQIQNQTIQII